MFYLIFSIICSVTVGIFFKIVKKYSVSFQQIINWNYVSALIFCFLAFQPQLNTVSSLQLPWPTFLILALLLPIVFIFMAASVKTIGIAKTDIAQRLSLCIPILVSVFIFKENISLLKTIGLGIGFLSIFLIFYTNSKTKISTKSILFPLLVFLGYGIIDLFFKQLASFTALPYTTSLFLVFVGALLISTLITLVQIFRKKEHFHWKNVWMGLGVGIVNFSNILFYLKAHKALASNPSTVFATMNFGVIVLGSIVGILVFKEKFNKINYWGIGAALVAIALVTLSQFYSF